MADFADYAISGDAFDEGLEKALGAFKAAVAKAYKDCKDSGVANLSPDDITVDTQITQLATDLTNAIHKFTLSAKIDTYVTFAGPDIVSIPEEDQVVDATMFPGPDGDMLTTDDNVEGPVFGETLTLKPVGGQLVAGTDPGPLDEQTGKGKGHLE